MAQCQAETGFADVAREGFPPLLCEENATDTGFCIFHDEKYLQDEAEGELRRKEVVSTLMQKVKQFTSDTTRDNRKRLVCNRYNLPGITIKEHFTNQVFFWDCHFHGTANFSGSFFESNANFCGSTFYQQTSFYNVGFVNPALFTSVKFLKNINFASAVFNNEAYFLGTIFSGPVDFNNTEFSGRTYFDKVKFSNEANFSQTKFNDETTFKYSLFEGKEKVLFDVKKLSKVSFINTDITRVTFGDEVVWGDKDAFKVIDEEKLDIFFKYALRWDRIKTNSKEAKRFEDYLRYIGLDWRGELQFRRDGNSIIATPSSNSFSIKEAGLALKTIFLLGAKPISSVSIVLDIDNKKALLKIGNTIAGNYEFSLRQKNDKLIVHLFEVVKLGSVKTVYRNLRENYEYRMRYDDAGEFFVREMELKRKYREIYSEFGMEVKASGILRRTICLTNFYSFLARYGESILQPSIFGAVVLLLSTLYWATQSKPNFEPSFTYKGLAYLGNAFERSVTVFLQDILNLCRRITLDLHQRTFQET